MKIWKVGDTSRAACESCRRLVATRFERRSIELPDGAGSVPDVLVDVCVDCGAIATIPPQSMPRINAARRRDPVRLDARLSIEIEEILGLLGSIYAGDPEAFKGALIRYGLRRITSDPGFAERVGARALAAVDGSLDRRLSVRVDRATLQRAFEVARRLGVADKSATVRGLILATADEADAPTPEFTASMEALAAAAVA